jgi:hypothetical protein
MPAAVIALPRHLRSMTAALFAGSTARGLAAVALFTAVQIADGILTFNGVARFGLEMESNPLLALSIAAVGAGVTLAIAKTIAVVLGTMLHRRHCHGALAALTMFYVVAALLPWTAALV